MKAAPVYQALASRHDMCLVHTGQHYDAEMSDVFLEELGLPVPDASLLIRSGTHAEQTARALVGIEAILLERRPAIVVVSGDVNSTLAGALAAVKLEIPVAHIESGLRSFDNSMPEEHNRKLTDHLSTILFTHSPNAASNLAREGIDGASIQYVGNTMIDSLLRHLETARNLHPWEELGIAAGSYGLVTLHRPELVDDPELLRSTTAELIGLAGRIPLVFPVHPRTAAHLTSLGLRSELDATGILTTEPLGYLDFLGLVAEARFVLTDSGGLQEEASALGVRCFTLRNATERPITVELGTNTLLGVAPRSISEIPRLLEEPKPFEPIPLWDGRAGARAADVLAAFVRGVAASPPERARVGS
jgi:UDP-N-acetylglucosamine 2-epimerase (non-hydrolysing)